MADSGSESTKIQVPSGIVLPGGCFIELDKFGLPASPDIKHSAYPICCCFGERDAIHIKYLIVWHGKYAKNLQIDKLEATITVCRLIKEWELKVPVWLQPIVNKWVEKVQNEPTYINNQPPSPLANLDSK
jgi:hypothetical protein